MIAEDSKHENGAGGRKALRRIRLEGLIEKPQHQEVLKGKSYVLASRDSLGFVASMMSIDQMETQHHLSALDRTAIFSIDGRQAWPIGDISDVTTAKITAITLPYLRSAAVAELPGKEVGEYLSHIRTLIKSVGIYSLSSLASPLATLVLAPFLTRYLSHAEYGALAVLNTAVTLLAGVTVLGLDAAFFRLYNYEYESPHERLRVLSTMVALLALTSIMAAFALFLAAPWLSLLLFNDASFVPAVRLLGLVVLVQNLTVPGFAWLRAESRAVFYSVLSVANLLVSVVANFTLVGFLHLGVAGSLLATGSGYALVLLCTLPMVLLRAGVHLRADIARELLSFGVPSVFTVFSVWILFFADRFLLARLGSLAQVASYSVAYSLGGVLSTVVLNPVTMAWPATMYSIAKRDDAAQLFRLVFRWYCVALLLAAFGLSLTSTVVLTLLFPPAYQNSAPIIPVIAASYMFYGVYIMFMTGTYIRRKTWYAVVFTTTAAISNVGLNLLLIPRYGSMGAAVATLVAYIIYTFISYIVNQRIYPIPYEIGRFFIEFLLGVALYTGAGILTRDEGRYEVWAIYIGALLLYGCILVVLGGIPVRRLKHNAWKFLLSQRRMS